MTTFGQNGARPYTDLSIDEYNAQFADGGADYLLLDVREVDEFQSGHLPGAVNLPMSEFQARFQDELPADKPIVVVCHTGVRSARVAAFMAQAGGFGDLYNLEGGTLRWTMRGFPLEY